MSYYGVGLGQSEAQRQTAHLAYANGQTAYDAGRYTDALNAFESAYATIPNATVLIAIAKTYEKLGQPARALQKYEAYLQSGEKQFAEEAQRGVRNLSPPPPGVTMPVTLPGSPALPDEPTAYDGGGASTVGVWVATGLGLAAVGIIAAVALRRPKRVTANRQGRRRRRRR